MKGAVGHHERKVVGLSAVTKHKRSLCEEAHVWNGIHSAGSADEEMTHGDSAREGSSCSCWTTCTPVRY